MARLSRLVVLSGLACVALLSASLDATVIVPADVNELAVDAAAIAHGRVVRVEAQQGEGRRVERLVTVQVFEYFKGGWGNVVQLHVPGGTLGRYQTVMFGTPEFEEGDEVVLFLGARDEAHPYLLGLHQGVFRIVADEATGQRMVMPPLVVGMESASRGRGAVNRQPMALKEFQGRIATALATPRAAAKTATPGVASRDAALRRVR